jgi:hypothetical protein
MTERQIPDPLDALRGANPADVDQLSSASLARVRARVQEVTMTDIEHERAPQRWVRRSGPLALASASLLAAAIAVALVALWPGSPRITPTPSTDLGVAQCIETYSLDTLRHREFAFDGTVTAIDRDEVTFAVNAAYRGLSVDDVTLTAMGMTGTSITSAGGPNLRVGSRYLVAGDDRFVWACGFTQDYDSYTASAWAVALRE